MGYTLDDLFGSSTGPKIDWAKLPNEGDFVKGKILEIDIARHKYDFAAKKNQYWVDGRPSPVDKAEAGKAGLRPVTYIVITVETKDGKKFQVDFDSKLAREALKNAIAERGSLDVGDGIGKRNTGKDGRAHKWDVKLFDWQD